VGHRFVEVADRPAVQARRALASVEADLAASFWTIGAVTPAESVAGATGACFNPAGAAPTAAVDKIEKTLTIAALSNSARLVERLICATEKTLVENVR